MITNNAFVCKAAIKRPFEETRHCFSYKIPPLGKILDPNVYQFVI